MPTLRGADALGIERYGVEPLLAQGLQRGAGTAFLNDAASQASIEVVAMSTQVTPLKVDDEDFLVSSLIDRCPKVMMLRELVQNALEAAALAPAGARVVEVFAREIGGVRKLGIWNTGPGMSRDELYRMGDLSASINKEKGLDQNFGMGAKVASLASNTEGMRYRSCHGGRVHEVLLGQRGGSYGRIWRSASQRSGGRVLEQYVDIAEVSELAREEGRDLSCDWTEVVLFGRRPDQDTAVDPYDGDPRMDAFWIPHALYRRFFRIGDGIELLLAEGLHWRDGVRRFEPIAARGAAFGRRETVAAPDGVLLHYTYDGPHPERAWENVSSEGALQSSESLLAIIYQNEMYDVQAGSPWAYVAPVFGIAFRARHFSVHIELPENYPVLPDGYRQFLRYRGGEQAQVYANNFAPLAMALRPAWLLDLLRSFGADARTGGEVQAELDDLARLLGVRLARDAPTDATGRMPELLLLHDEQDVRDRWLGGRAACFHPETGQVFVNARYPSALLLAERLAAEFAGAAHPTAVAAAARAAAESCLVRRVGRTVLFGLAKHDDPEHWHPGHVEKAVAPESLSVAADDLEEMLPWARNRVRFSLTSVT
jgi:hypothetical protein